MGKYKPPMMRDRPSPAAEALSRAEELQQQAERKRGEAAIPSLQEAAVAYKEVLDLSRDGSLPGDRLADCHFGLGECMQQLGERILEGCAALPDAQLSAEVEADARRNAAAVFRQAADAYQKVQSSEDGMVRADACVNAANTLSAWAGVEALRGKIGQAADLLTAAVEGYRRALEQEEDAATWSNLADTLVSQAELLEQQGKADAHMASMYSEAMAAYGKACMLSSSEEGDDLPGLLNNWGVGLHSLGTHAQDHTLALSSLEAAAQRLREAISFSRGDPQPHNALGDTLMVRADLAGDPSEALGFLDASLQEGYTAALRLISQDANACVGSAEVHTASGKMAVEAGNTAAAAAHFLEALRFYRAALQTPEALGTLRDRSDVRYNYACVCAHAMASFAVQGDDAAAAQQECLSSLSRLTALGMTTPEQIMNDADFSLAKGQAWFAPVLGILTGQSQLPQQA